jgi:hypothetical protein
MNDSYLTSPTSTMVLKVVWTDIEWGEHHSNHFLSRFHGPEGFWHRRGDTSEIWYVRTLTTTSALDKCIQ